MTIETTVSQPSFFTGRELGDILACAKERGITVARLVHDAVMEDLHR